MTPGAEAQHRVLTCSGDSLEAVLASALAAVVEARVQAALTRLEAAQRAQEDADDPEWLSQVDAARRAGVTPQTIREWQAAGKLTKGRRGRVHLVELRRFLGDVERPVEHPAHLDELRQERARRAAQEILAKRAVGSGGRDGR